jgi:alpha-L-fucosidase
MAAGLGLGVASSARADIHPGPFKADWTSLSSNYKTPEWFRDAKFGIWAHWSAQCVPEQGDWYARRMYLQGDPAYDYHVKTYGHPSKVGFMEIENLWKAERWEPEKLTALYKKAGAKYFFALANHHDNFDAYNSRYHGWNSVKVGPKKDIVGTWGELARQNGLKFGVSNHSSWSARWFQPAYGYDGEGPLAGVRYDAATLGKAGGKGKWWEGLDPQALYCGPSLVMPNGLKSAAAVRDWQAKNTSLAKSNPLPVTSFNHQWFLRCQDLVDHYTPDLLYFDTNELPLEQVGLDVVAHYYNASAARNHGRTDVVVFGKHILPEHNGAFVEDIERGVANAIRPEPWQTDTCIGDWHYSRAVAEENRYKTVAQVVRMLIDIVSKNGNLLLNIPLRGDGSVDDHELAFLDGLGRWMAVNEDGIFATRPWKVYGEGPTVDNPPRPAPGTPKEAPILYTSEDIRFVTKDGALYAHVLAQPQTPKVRIRSLATGAVGKITKVSLLGFAGAVVWRQDSEGLSVDLPTQLPSEHTLALRVEGIA